MLRLLRSSPRAPDGAMLGDSLLPMAALEFESPSAAIIATPVPPLASATNLMVFLMVFAMLTASGLIRIDKIVSATGQLVTQAPNITMQSFDKTIIESIDVRKGDIVRKGDVLARLNPTFAAADLTALKDQMDLLRVQTARLEAEIGSTNYVPDLSNPHADLEALIFRQRASEYDFSLKNFQQKMDQLQTQISGNKAQVTYYRQRMGVATNVEAMRQELQNRQIGSKLNTLIATDTRLNMAAALAQSDSDAAQAARTLSSLQAERETFIQHWKVQASQDLADTRGKLVQAEQAYAKSELHSQLVVLTAPRDAVVLSVEKVSAGSVVDSGQALMQLVPVDAHLSIEADISGIDSGYVRQGDKVRIKFDTLPFHQYGSAQGVVRTISADSFSPEATSHEGGSTLPSRPNTLYYRGEISLDELMLHNTPPGFRLVPGMPVTVDVMVGTRSVLSYFVNKIVPIVSDSMREP